MSPFHVKEMIAVQTQGINYYSFHHLKNKQVPGTMVIKM